MNKWRYKAKRKNPQRKTLWTPLYDDEAGNGNMITALAPVYANDKFVGVVGIDITIEKILKNFILRNTNNESFIVDSEFRPAIFSEKRASNLFVSLNEAQIEESAELNKSLPKNNVVHKRALNPDLLQGLKSLDNPEGFHSIAVDGRKVHFTITKIDKLNWYYVTVLAKEEMLSMPNELNQELEWIINDLMINSVTLYLVLLVLIVVVISWIVSKILEPIAQLTDTTKLIANGDYDKEIKFRKTTFQMANTY